MSNKYRKMVKIANVSVPIVSSEFSEEVLQDIVSFAEQKFTHHDRASSSLNEKEKLVVTLLDITAEFFAIKQKLKRLEQVDSENSATIKSINKRLDDFFSGST